MHKLSETGFSPVLSIHIQDMFPVFKGFTRGKVDPLNRIDRLALAVKIFLSGSAPLNLLILQAGISQASVQCSARVLPGVMASIS